MKEVSSADINNINQNIENNISDLKIYPTTISTKEIQNYNISTINKKNNISNANNNLIFKITEKECSDINSIVRNSVEKINDLLNSKEFANNNFSRTLKRSSKNCFSEVLDREKEKEKENEKDKILKAKTLKESGMKTNFTFNINNFINVPNDQNKNESINMNKKTERDEEDDEYGITNELTFSEKNIKNSKAKTNQKGINANNRIKNNNYINYGTNRHSNGKLFRNCVRKKKLFDDAINNNYNNNINIVNFTNGQKNKKSQKIDTKEDKDKSITVNKKYKKTNNANDNTNNDMNKGIIHNQNNNILNNALKHKQKENNNSALKNSISEDINNSKIQSIKKNNILSKFTPNIININSLSDHRNIKNYILNNKDINKSNKQINNNSVSKYNIKNKPKEINKKIFSPQYNKRYKQYLDDKSREKEMYYNNINLINEMNNEKNVIKKNKNSTFPLNNPINNQVLDDNNNNKDSFSNKINSKLIDIEFCDLDGIEKRKSTNNNPKFKKEISCNYIRNCGHSCERFNKNYSSNNSSQNVHTVLNKIYSKEFPTKVKTNNIMKLMLFLNEYLINNNLLDDYYDINNRNKLDNYSKFICEQINIDFPQETDVNIDKMVSSAKKNPENEEKKKDRKIHWEK